MRILLINTNPVVSRLFKLAGVNSEMALDEVENIDHIHQVSYAMVCVDDSAYSEQVQLFIDALEGVKRVFISYGSKEMEGFDLSIKKPFLPAQISYLIQTVEQDDALHDTHKSKSDTKILDTQEIEKIKTLLKMDDEMAVDASMIPLSEEGYEARKVEVIKEQLLSEGLQLIEEKDMVEAVSNQNNFPKQDTSLLSEAEMALFQEAFSKALQQIKPKKIKKFLAGGKVKFKLQLEDHV